MFVSSTGRVNVPISELNQLRERFVKTLNADVRSLTKLHEKDAKSAGRPGQWLGAIRRSSIVLIGANLENFVEDLVCTSLHHLADRGVKARRYPEGFIVWRFQHTAQSRDLSPENTKELLDLSLRLYSEVRKLRHDELLVEEIREIFSNPTPRNVNWIMSLLDRSDYVGGLQVAVEGNKTSVNSALHELARRRNSIAHGDSQEDPSLGDVKRLLTFAQNFSTKIKNDVAKATEKACNIFVSTQRNLQSNWCRFMW